MSQLLEDTLRYAYEVGYVVKFESSEFWKCYLALDTNRDIVRANGGGLTPCQAFESMLDHYKFLYGIDLTTKDLRSSYSSALLMPQICF